MYTLGVDIGASSVKVVALALDGTPLSMQRQVHQGAVRPALSRMLDALGGSLGPGECAGVALTGTGAQGIARDAAASAPGAGAQDVGGLPLLEEVPAATLGAQVLAPEAAALMCIGAQSSYFVALPEGAGAPAFATNDSCASGTGSFFEDQMARLGLRIEDYSQLAARAQSVPRLSGRCTVFAKTDIIHRQQEGVPVEDILQGLCHAMVKSFKATIVRGLPWRPPLALAGGVVLNGGVVRAVREVFALGEDELLATPDLVYLQAAGAALHAQGGQAGTLPALVVALAQDVQAAPLAVNEPLPRIDYVPGAGFPECSAPSPEGAAPLPCALGVDVGSTSTNLVLLDLAGNMVDAQYLRTRGNPREAVLGGMASIQRRLGGRVEVVAAGTTGSGRVLIGDMIGADVVRDEITAQARAAAAADPGVTTVFEIGGQDSKFIHLKDGQVDDFQMNKVCAAGTGSFVEEQAARLGIPLDEYGDLALSSDAPVDLGERCTVFVETAIAAAMAQGAQTRDVAAGLCQSIVRNYLYRVVSGKHVGHRIVLQGGVAYNAGIVAAFKQRFGDALTVSPYFAVSGAVGVALLALEARDAALAAGQDAPSAFRGFQLERRPVVGLRQVDAEQVAANRAYFRRVDELFLEGYDPTRDPAKKTVGVPRCLMLHKLFPMVNAFFRELGYNVVLSNASTEETVRLSQQAAQGEVCYPVKLIHGHMLQLLDEGVDYIFFPRMHTIRHVKSMSPHNYACTYMQTAPTFLAHELDFEGHGVKLISPLMEMDFGQEAMANALLGVGRDLGHGERESARAMLAGGFAVNEFTRKTEDLGEELLSTLGPNERAIVIVARQYDILDPVLNMGIPDAFLDRGCKVITLSHLHAHDLDLSHDYPGVCWPFGQHIISGAKLVRRDPRLYAVYLTNHGCGPDTMISHYFRDEMGEKPYLQIEMDEHYSKVGIITRIEAFLNAIEHHRAKDERSLPLSVPRPDGTREPLLAEQPAFLPEVGLYGRFAAEWLRRAHGADVRLVAPDAQAVGLGKQGTDTKEYLTFAATLGVALESARRAGDAPAQLLLASTEGTEPDSQYDRVVRSMADARGLGALRIVAPRLEQLPWTEDDAFGLFMALIAADVCYAAPAQGRKAIVDGLLGEHCSMDALAQAAQLVRQMAAEPAGKGTLSVVGEWPLAYSSELTGGALDRLEAQGWRLSRMPLSEYLLFLWRDAVDADRRERSNAPFMLDGTGRGVMPLPSCDACDACGKAAPAAQAAQPAAEGPAFDARDLPNFAIPTDEKLARLVPFEQLMAFVSESLGPASPFAPSLQGLRDAADAAVGPYRGGNGRYRAAKAQLPPGDAVGVIAVASMYENTDIMLRLREGHARPPLPTLHLEFDGVLDKGIEEKLGSFLFYLE